MPKRGRGLLRLEGLAWDGRRTFVSKETKYLRGLIMIHFSWRCGLCNDATSVGGFHEGDFGACCGGV